MSTARRAETQKVHYGCPMPGGFEPACSPPGVEADPGRFVCTTRADGVNCKRCLSWLKEE